MLGKSSDFKSIFIELNDLISPSGFFISKIIGTKKTLDNNRGFFHEIFLLLIT
jgi:hypothetical protein